MTVSTLHVRTDAYAGDGVSTVFPVTFQFLGGADLRVIEVSAVGVETPKSLGVDYTVSGGAGGTGNVTALSAPPAGVFWVIVRQTGRDQPISWAEGGPLTAASLQRAVDKNALLVQEADNRAERGVRLPDSDPDGLTMTLPAAAARAGKAVVFNADGGVAVSEDAYNDQLANVTAQAGIATGAATTATTQAGIATTGAATATAQAGIATTGAATATTQAEIATTGANTATTQAGVATGAATTATTQAGIATAGANTATTQAGIATTGAATATTQAGIATTGAATATTQAGVAVAGANSAAASAAAAAGLVADVADYWCVASGSATAIILTPVHSPAPGAVAAGLTVRFKAAAAATGAATINFAGLGAAALTEAGGAAIDAGAFVNGELVEATYDGTAWRRAAAGKRLSIRSQGVEVMTAAATMNFVGGGVAAAADGTVTIPGAGASTAMFNSGDKAAIVTLTNGNRTAQNNATAQGSVRGFALPTSGKYYWEYYVQQYNGQIGFGVATAVFNINGAAGFHVHSWGVYFGIAGAGAGWKRIYGNGSYLSDLGMAIAVNSTVGFAVDLTAGHLWVAVNGAWQNGGNPLSGASPLISGLPAGLYPAVGINGDGANPDIVQFRPSVSGWVYGAPAGYSSLP